jgi:hypothetical protein
LCDIHARPDVPSSDGTGANKYVYTHPVQLIFHNSRASLCTT